MKKGNIGIQTIFYIMMGIVFVSILIFGVRSLMVVEENISEQERVDLTRDLEKTLVFCDEPLNKGTTRVHNIKHSKINGICVFSDGVNGNNVNDGEGSISADMADMAVAVDNGDNVIFFSGEAVNSGSGFEIISYDIQGVSNVDLTRSDINECYFDEEGSGVLEARITCK